MFARWGVFAMALLGSCVVAMAAEAPYALVVAHAPGGAGAMAPVTVRIDFAEVAAALGVAPGALEGPVSAGLERAGGQLAAVPAQFDPESSGSLKGELTLLLPAGSEGQRVRVYFTKDRPPLTVPTVAPLQVEEQAGKVVISAPSFRITHDPAKMGGLPSRIEFAQTGKVADTFSLNDRIYEGKLLGFQLRDDREPRIEVLSRGPLRATVQVTARYMQGEQPAPSGARATYRFTYYAGSPLVRIEARMTQDEALYWPELHLWEYNFPDQSFTRWIAGEPEATGELKADESNHAGGSWTALSDGENLIAVVGQYARIYDGRGGYGTYLHGPWVSWTNMEQPLEVTLWIGSAPADRAAATLRAAAADVGVARWATLSVRPLEGELAALDRAVEKLTRGEQAHWRWLEQLVRRSSGGEGRLRSSIDLARQMAALAAKKASVTQAEAVLRKATGERLTVVSTPNVGWAFEKAGSQVRPVSCFDLASGREVLAASPAPLWEANLQRPDGTKVTVNAAEAATSDISVQGSEVQLRWRMPEDRGGATVNARVGLSGPDSSWIISMTDLAKGWSVRECSFPQIAVGPIGASAEDDYLLWPQGSGILRRAPLRGSVEYDGMYPDGWCTFQMMAYYDADCGVYFGCHDPLASTKHVTTRRTADGNAQLLAFRWYAPDMGQPDNGFTASAPTVMRTYRGDWFDATQIYRAWAEKEARWWPRETAWNRPDTPQWMREVCVWACTGGAASECVQKVKDFAKFMGAPTAFHWYSWHEIPFDVKYPHYFPTKPGMAEGVKELQAAGVRVMPYINGRLWDTQLEDFQQTAIAAATKGEDGKPYIEEYGSGAKLAPMCPTQKLWQDKVQEIVLRLVTEVGVDGVYIDQVGAAAPRLCMDKSHGHPLGGGHWWTEGGYWPLLTSLQAKLPPEKMITTECNAESYARWFDAYLTWHWQSQDMVPAFSAIYAGRVQLFSRSYGGNDQQAHCMKIGQQLVFGEQLGWLDPAAILPHADTADFMRRAAQTRHALLDFLAWGRMARPPVVEGDIPEVTADWAWGGKSMVTASALQKGAWWAQDGRLLLLFANTSEQPIKAAVVFDATAYGWPKNARLTLTPTGAEGPGKSENCASSFRRQIELGPRGIAAFILSRS